MTHARVTFVILAGGRGERLWPLVRTHLPKVCVPADGRRPLLQATLDRLSALRRQAQALVVTTAQQAEQVRRVLPPSLRRSVLVEPEGKNTAACIALAAGRLSREPDRIMVVLPADHWIRQPASFCRSVRAGIAVAQEHQDVVMIGIKPSRVHPGLGHLTAAGPAGMREGVRVFRLHRFLEKPPRVVAQRLLRTGTTYWNAGVFIGRVDVFQECFRRYLPEHARRLLQGGSTRSPQKLRAAYRAINAVSFDDGIMAHRQSGWIVEGRFDWEDLGSWDSWIRLNRLQTPPILIDGSNVRVLTQGRHLIATIGLRDVVVVQTRDVTLICRTRNAQTVRQVVRHLKQDPRLARYL